MSVQSVTVKSDKCAAVDDAERANHKEAIIKDKLYDVCSTPCWIQYAVPAVGLENISKPQIR